MVFTVFCLPLAFKAQAFDTPDLGLFINHDCKKFLQTNCQELPATLKRSLEACAINAKAHNCEKLAQRNPDLKMSIITCQPRKFCEQTLLDGSNEALSCWQGLKGSAVDTVEAITGLVTDAWEKTKNDRTQRQAFITSCEPSVTCKRNLVKDMPYYHKLSDKDLNKHSAGQLYDLAKHQKMMLEAAQNNFSTYLPKNLQKPTDQKGEASDKLADLWRMAETLGKEKYHEFACLTPTAQQELKCYLFGSIVDPTLVVGKGVKLVKAQRLLRALKGGTAAQVSKLISKEDFTIKYLHYAPTNKTQNLKWMSLAENTKPANVKFFDVENSVMKELNDTIRDKNLVTSLTNYHKDLLRDKTEKLFAKLKKTYPDLEMIPYSDFKASRFAFKGRGPPDLEQQLGQVLQQTNQEFKEYVVKNQIARPSDDPGKWFRAGFGETADQATLAARFARQSQANTLQSYSSAGMKAALTTKLEKAESLRSKLQSELGNTSMLESTGSIKTLSSEALDILRKNGDDLKKSHGDLKNRFGLRELPMTTVKNMKDYVLVVDEFSPGIHIAQREVANLDEAVFGGLSADMAGMGAKNLSGTAKALSESKTLDQALEQTRKAEKIVTAQFNQQKKEFQNILNEVVGGTRIKTVCSGDDCVAIPKQALTDREKSQILGKLSEAGYASKFRLSFIADNVTNTAARTQLSVDGETIEKTLRKNLADKLEPNKLKGLIFGIDMKTSELNRGPVKLITVTHSDVKLTSHEQKLIQENFRKALQQISAEYQVWQP